MNLMRESIVIDGKKCDAVSLRNDCMTVVRFIVPQGIHPDPNMVKAYQRVLCDFIPRMAK